MRLFIDRDFLNSPKPPVIYLCNTAKKIIGELPASNRSGNFKWNSYSELSFEIPRTYVDMITGETKIHPLYDKTESPRNILLKDYAYFALQDVDDTSNDGDIKNISAFSLEYATSNKYLTNFRINTGEIDSKEVIYNEQTYGIDYNTDMDSFYKLASGEFDPYESYYQQVYTDTDSYTYEQIQINDKTEYGELIKANQIPDSQPHEKLYMKKFANVQFYNNNKEKSGLSLLHLIFENIPEWKIGNVDQSLWRKERKFSEDRISVYDFIQNNLSETFGCVTVWDSLAGLVHFYEELEDDSDIENEANTMFETDVFISKDNLASEVKVSYSADDIKTKLVVTGSDNLDIREVNLGRNEIMDLSFYHTEEWMEQDLFEAYNNYINELQEAQTGLMPSGRASNKYPMAYPDAMKGWVSANNRWSDLMNEVPADGNVVLVGDEFKKLYCTFSPINTAYSRIVIGNGTEYVEAKELYLDEALTKPIPEPSGTKTYVVQEKLLIYNTGVDEQGKIINKFKVHQQDANKLALIDRLNLYHVDEDTDGTKQDNILLKLKHPQTSDIATIRIYDEHQITEEYMGNKMRYYAKDSDGKWLKYPIKISDGADFKNKKNTYKTIYTNNYKIQSIVVPASSGAPKEKQTYDIKDWIDGNLTTTKMTDLSGYKITYIGTMGAYFVLAKDEKNPENLQDYGVKLLQEKHKTYTTIFQTQTEEMFSQEKSQCIIQDEEPEKDYAPGTRWLDSNSSPMTLYELIITKDERMWKKVSSSMSDIDQADYENYQRYVDNYEKLQTVQEILVKKERESEYCKDGYSVPDRVIDLYKMGTDGAMRYNGQELKEDMQRVAKAHFGNNYTISDIDMNQSLPLYKFGTSFDPIVYGENTKPYNPIEQYYIKVEIDKGEYAYQPVEIINQDAFDAYNQTLYVVTSGHEFAVYLKGTTPYVAYANSQGVYQMIMEYIRNNTEMNKFFTVDQWIRLSPLIKEDEFNDSNFLLTGYESEEERIKICQELMEAANKELKTLCKPSLKFSMTMANILALPEFEPIFDQFQLGNFIRVGIRDGYVKRSRLLEVNINFDDLGDFSCTFGNLVTTKSEIDKHADLLKTAVTAGKQVAKSSGSWQKAVDKTNKLEEDISNGLADMVLAVGSASGQAISWDSTGMHFRKYRDGSTTEFEPEEIAIINNALVATNDSWRTSKAAFGKYQINGEDRWGPIAEYVTADRIEGKLIKGGSIQIGDETKEGGSLFIVNEDGSVEIRSGGTNYVDAMKVIDNAYRFQVILEYEGLTVFSDTETDYCQVTCKVYDHNKNTDNKDITSQIIANGGTFTWKRALSGDNSTWTPKLVDGKPNIILIKHGDVDRNAQFSCSVYFDETKFNTEGGVS